MLLKKESVPLLPTTREKRHSWIKSGIIVLVVIGVVATLQANRPSGTVDERKSAKIEEKTIENDMTNMGNLKLSKSRVGVDKCPRGLKNIAQYKTAVQSSVQEGLSSGVEGGPDAAVDGIKDNLLWHGSCTHTKKEYHPYWFVNLEADYDVCKVTITNRRGRARSRLSNFIIFVTDTPPIENILRVSPDDVCHRQDESFEGTREFPCDKRGRFVGVQILEQEYLTLCEVEVYGTPVGGPVTTVPPGLPTTTALPQKCNGERIRKSWFDISPHERDLYISGYIKLAKMKRAGVFAKDHRNSGPRGGYEIHNHINFLPWHRYFIFQFEEQIRGLGPDYACFTLPYWDWTRSDKMGITVGSKPNNPMLTDRYFGGNGHGKCVKDGKFSEDSGYRTSDDRCLTRNFDNGYSYASLYDVRQVIINERSFKKFRSMTEFTGGHANAHNSLGGVTSTHSSPDDPMFYLIHSFVDLYWALRSDCLNFDESEEVTRKEFPKEDLLTELEFPELSLVDWWPKGKVTTGDMLRIGDWGYTYDASTLLTRERGYRALKKCTFTEIKGRDVTDDELAFFENSDSVAATVYRQMRDSPLKVTADDSDSYCRRTGEKECLLRRAELLRRGILKRECHYNVEYEKCGGSNEEDGVLIIPKQELLDKPGVRGNPCLEEVREMYFDWAEETSTLRELCNGDYDPSCIR